jgi:hypothetical protein
MAAGGAAVMQDATIEAMLDLLADPNFVMPFALRYNVSARRPGARPSP